MGKPATCPTCHAPCTVEHDWTSSSYHFDTWRHKLLLQEVVDQKAEITKLRADLANAKAHANRMVKGRKAAETKMRALIAGVPQEKGDRPDAL